VSLLRENHSFKVLTTAARNRPTSTPVKRTPEYKQLSPIELQHLIRDTTINNSLKQLLLEYDKYNIILPDSLIRQLEVDAMLKPEGYNLLADPKWGDILREEIQKKIRGSLGEDTPPNIHIIR
jgi:hypothetical protein